MVDDWMPILFKVGIAVVIGFSLYKFLPNEVTDTVINTVGNFLGNLF